MKSKLKTFIVSKVTLFCSNCTGNREYHSNFLIECSVQIHPLQYNIATAKPLDKMDATTTLLIVIVILTLLFVSYVGYKNYQKVSFVYL